MTELLADGSNEARSTDELEGHDLSDAVVNSDHQTSFQGCCPSDAAKRDANSERGFTADCNNVPSFSRNFSAVNEHSVETVPIVGDPDILLYMALGTAIAIISSALYTRLVKK